MLFQMRKSAQRIMLIPNDQLRRNGVRSSNLIVSVCKSVCLSVPSFSKADRDEPRSADERSESAGVGLKAGVGPKGLYEPNRTDRSVLL